MSASTHARHRHAACRGKISLSLSLSFTGSHWFSLLLLRRRSGYIRSHHSLSTSGETVTKEYFHNHCKNQATTITLSTLYLLSESLCMRNTTMMGTRRLSPIRERSHHWSFHNKKEQHFRTHCHLCNATEMGRWTTTTQIRHRSNSRTRDFRLSAIAPHDRH